MTRAALPFAAVALVVVLLPGAGHTANPFDQRLTSDQQIVHALNRLTFGPRPGDVDQVRRLGLSKWIDLQLHPDQINENPVLEEKLKPLETLRMSLPDVIAKYTPEPNKPMVMVQGPFEVLNKLPQADRNKVMNGTAEERTATLDAMEPEMRHRVLGALPPNVIAYTPKYKDEAEEARKAQQQEMQARIRKLNPQLRDLLSEDQLAEARSGDQDKVRSLFAALPPDKRLDVVPQLPPKSLAVVPEYRRAGLFKRAPRTVASQDLKEARVFRAVYSNRQLEEMLVDFWFNHFNVDSTKNVGMTPNLGLLLIGSYERDAIRPHVLGHFRDLLLATARHPAMLYYLDNWESLAPNAFDVGPYAPRRGFVNGVPNAIIPNGFQRLAHGLNENYGREVMELHTLGVNGGYTQNDVIAVARCFTGWTVRSPENPGFVFAPFMHDYGEKTVLGHKIPAGGGEQDGLQVIDILAHHPSTAKFISMELARHFVADHPPQALVDRMASTFMKTDGDLRAVMETLFRSKEFFSEGAWEARLKSPLDMAAGTIRAMGGEVTDAYALVQRISDMGEALYAKIEPTGYPDVAETWLSTAGIMARMNFAASIGSGQVPGVQIDASRWKGLDEAAVARDLLGRDASKQTLDALKAGLEGRNPSPAVVASLVLGSPDFERR
jgi:uncharacterized protein (DUF1800 family)